jgi:hypothetical protein
MTGPALDEQFERIKELIKKLPSKQRSMLRPWILAAFDVSGKYSEPYHAAKAREEGRDE